jgi:hypothetical protein
MDLELRKTIRRIIVRSERDLSMRMEGWLAFVPESRTYFVFARGKSGCPFLYAVDVLAGKVLRKQILGIGSKCVH